MEIGTILVLVGVCVVFIAIGFAIRSNWRKMPTVRYVYQQGSQCLPGLRTRFQHRAAGFERGIIYTPAERAALEIQKAEASGAASPLIISGGYTTVPRPPVATNRFAIRGTLTHKRIYVYGVAPSGRSSTSCALCGRPNQHVFSNCEDEGNAGFRCCLWCLRRFGGEIEIKRACRSKYARRVVECMGALDQLLTEFPNPERRPYGEQSLLSEIAHPFNGFEGIQRILSKIQERRWTKHDLARIEGRPEPE